MGWDSVTVIEPPNLAGGSLDMHPRTRVKG